MKNINNPPITRRNKNADPNILASSLAEKVSLSEVHNHAIDITNMPSDFLYNSAKGDGSDETVTLQNILNYISSNNKTMLIPSGKTFVTADLYVTGASNFSILGYGTLKRKNSAANQATITLKGCNNVYIPYLKTDGNIGGNGGTVQQGQHALSILDNSGTPSTDIIIGTLDDHNPGGDTLYINNANNLIINSVKSVSDGFTGRNAISIIKGQNILIGNLLSLNTGYYNSSTPSLSAPGGFDIEPNLNTDNVQKIRLMNAYILTAGTGGCQATNYNGATCDDIVINATVHRYYNPTTYLFTFNQCSRVKATCIGRTFQTTADTSLMSVVSCHHIDLDVDLYGGDVGILLDGTTALPTQYFKIRGRVDTCNTACIRVRVANNGEIDAALKNPQFNTTMSKGVIVSDSGCTSSKIIFRGDFSKDTRGQYCFIINGNVSNWRAENVNMNGFNDGQKVVGTTAYQGGLFAVNCYNYNYEDTPSQLDAYAKGMVVWKVNPTASGQIGSVCTVTGIPCTTAWVATTTYSVGNYVYSASNVYQCTTAGTSGSTAPTGTATSNTDGTVVWQYMGTLGTFKTFGNISA